MLPYVAEGVGAVASQAWVNVNLGYQGIELMRLGLSARSALEALLGDDKGRSRRQVIAVDMDAAFGYTGDMCTEVKGHIVEEDFAVAGNILASRRVLDDMAEAFRRSKGELNHRLLTTLEAGQKAGGDSRGKLSATLRVASSKPRLSHNLRVDYHKDPLAELRRILERCEELEEEYRAEDDEGEVLRLKVVRAQK
jgi:uncharacterized Ntn-hydrolase superfamily protein